MRKQDIRRAKKRALFFLLIFTIPLFPLYALQQSVDESNFQEGSFYRTEIDSANHTLRLQDGYSNGTYTSKIFNLGRESHFQSISWVPFFPIGKELPNREASETIYAEGNADMSENRVLLHLNESGGDTFADGSGRGNGGTCTGANCPSAVNGIFGNAQYINGESLSRISILSNNDTNPGANPLTICHWFKIDNARTNQILYNKEDLYEAAVTNGYYKYAWRPHWAWDGGTSFSVNSNTWYFACLVYDKSKQRLYKNGVEVYSRNQTGDIGSNANNLCLGARGANNCDRYRYKGAIDEFALWQRALSAEEIRDLYQRGVSHLKISVRSCDDSQCDSESFQDLGGDTIEATNAFPVKDVSLSDNQYFQFKLEFSTDDGSVLPSIQSFTFNYEYVNHPPVAIRLSSTEILEESPVGTVIAVLTTEDPDLNDTHTYSFVSGIGGEDNSLFTIDGNQLKLNFVPDYENPIDQGDIPENNTYTVRIRTDDGNGGSYEQSFVLTVRDIDENAPVLSLVGENPLILTQGEDFTDPGATAVDQEDGDISQNIVVTGDVDTSRVGTYTLTYTVEDSSGNQAIPITRTVIVRERKRIKRRSKRVPKEEVRKMFQKVEKRVSDERRVVASPKKPSENKPSLCRLPTNRLLKNGVHGEDVKQLQHCLNILGYPAGPEDGIFGPQTYQGVLSFQRAKQLRFVDGVVGEETVRALRGEERTFQMQEQKGEEKTFDRKVILQKIDALEKMLLELKKLVL